jgi:uncharacterized protein YndB with AHSA1/START domain/predicted enzyme related to lactoylglutathione lyase
MASARTKSTSARRRAGDAGGRRLIIVRDFAAPRALVFKAFTDPAHLVRWWGPQGFTVPECRMDVRPGGVWRTVMRSPSGTDHPVGGVFQEIVPSRRLAMTWAWEGENGRRGHETVLTIELDDRRAGTRLTLTQEPFESAKARNSHRGGWQSSFECLVEALRDRLSPRPAAPVVHFELLTDKPETAGVLWRFYRHVFGWSIDPNNPMSYGMVERPKKGAGIGGGIGPGAPKGQGHITIYLAVPKLGGALKAVAKAGGKILMKPMKVPGGPRIAQFTDPAGNRIGLVEG